MSLLTRLHDAIDARKDISKAFRSALDYYFGSLEKAKLALKTHKRFLNRWSRKKIIGILAQRHRLHETLDHKPLERESRSLVAAAVRHFGSWGNALDAAGIDPNLYFVRNKWIRTKPWRQLRSRVATEQEWLKK